jgi:hypothetical protein
MFFSSLPPSPVSRSRYSPQHPVLKHFNMCSSVSVRDRVSHPYSVLMKCYHQLRCWLRAFRLIVCCSLVSHFSMNAIFFTSSLPFLSRFFPSNCKEQGPSGKLTVAYLVEKFPHSNGTQRFNTVFITFRKAFLMVRSCWPLTGPRGWSSTPCRLAATAYSVYSRLRSVFGGSPLHPRLDDAPCRGDWNPLKVRHLRWLPSFHPPSFPFVFWEHHPSHLWSL